ncbi:Rieske (2Fe-2S) protein [Thioflexithrix psekupsensis]|nr:Rieske (2Fe-2S) protein [Thioflexithrix psekupsensis]
MSKQMTQLDTDWLPLAELYQIPEQGCLFILVNDDLLLVGREGENVHCFEAKCPHLGYSLELGQVNGDSITCPFHKYRFSLKDGHCRNAICDNLTRYEVKIENQHAFVKFNR